MLDVVKLGRWDRILRIVIGGGLLAYAGGADGYDGWSLGAAVTGAALLVTGLVGSCMLYPLLRSGATRRCSR
jgi:hypothetical protein